jgi:hypothetical protein
MIPPPTLTTVGTGTVISFVALIALGAVALAQDASQVLLSTTAKQPTPTGPPPPPTCSGTLVSATAGAIQAAVNAHGNNTTFCIAAGTYHEAVIPKSGDVFWGANIGQTILDGSNSLTSAFLSNGAAITDVTIKNMTIQHYNGFAGVYPSCCNGASGWLIDTVEVAFNNNEGFDIGPNTTIQNSLIHDNFLNGVHAANGPSIVANNNDIYANNTSLSDPCTATSDSAGQKLSGVTSALYTNNKMHNNNSSGLWFDITADHRTIAFNEFFGNVNGTQWCGSNGFIDEIGAPHTSYGINLFHDNYLHDNGPGADLQLSNSGSWDIYNNTMVQTQNFSGNGGAVIILFDEGARSDITGCGGTGGLCLLQYIRIYNNIIVTNGDYTYYNQDDGTPGSDWAHSNNQWGVPSGNTYYLPASGSALFHCTVSNSGACSTQTSYTFSQWQALSFNPDTNSTAVFNGGTLPNGVGVRGGFVCNSNMGTAAGSLGVCP